MLITEAHSYEMIIDFPVITKNMQLNFDEIHGRSWIFSPSQMSSYLTLTSLSLSLSLSHTHIWTFNFLTFVSKLSKVLSGRFLILFFICFHFYFYNFKHSAYLKWDVASIIELPCTVYSYVSHLSNFIVHASYATLTPPPWPPKIPSSQRVAQICQESITIRMKESS